MEHALQLEIAHTPLEPFRIAFDVRRGGFVVLALGELQQLRGIRNGLGRAVDLPELRGELGTLAPELLGLLGFLPDRRVLQLAIDFL